jgi:hypothetical protein
MASKSSAQAAKKTFGKKKKGMAKKKFNKHSPKPKEYRGQGR